MKDYSRAREHLVDEQPEARVQRMWSAIEARRHARPRPARYAVAGAAALVCTAAIVAVVFAWPSGDGAIELAGGEAVPERISGEATLALSDGSEIFTSERALLEVLDNGDTRVTLALRSGRARFDIEPGGRRAWRIECGGVSVEVVGTRFTVERSELGTSVSVTRGAVLVRGASVPDGVQRLGPGDRFETPRAPLALAGEPNIETENDEPREPEAIAEVVTPSESHRVAPSHEPPARIDWRREAAAGHHREAFESMGASGLTEETERAADVSSLLALADVARLSGNASGAVAPLSRIVWEFPSDPNAPSAAFTLAELELETLRRPARAERAYARSIALGLPEPLRETAYARRVEALAQSGGSVERAAAEYRALYPNGRYDALVTRWSEP